MTAAKNKFSMCTKEVKEICHAATGVQGSFRGTWRDFLNL